jgi:hypothetical protein
MSVRLQTGLKDFWHDLRDWLTGPVSIRLMLFLCANDTRRHALERSGRMTGWPSTGWMQHPHSWPALPAPCPSSPTKQPSRHVALDFIAHCGLPGASELHVYRTVQEAEAMALELMANGGKLAYNFGTLPGLETRSGQHLVSPICMQCSMPSSRLKLLCRAKILRHA